mgnify:CR=1 FL=1
MISYLAKQYGSILESNLRVYAVSKCSRSIRLTSFRKEFTSLDHILNLHYLIDGQNYKGESFVTLWISKILLTLYCWCAEMQELFYSYSININTCMIRSLVLVSHHIIHPNSGQYPTDLGTPKLLAC